MLDTSQNQYAPTCQQDHGESRKFELVFHYEVGIHKPVQEVHCQVCGGNT